jgi:hypothetical protein
LRVVICPDQVALSPLRRSLGLRGLRRTIDAPHIVPCNGATGAPPWRAALQALETALPGFANGKTTATVILSNHFLRYALVPWHAELADAEEDLSLARHCFARVYGKDAQQWELRLNHEAPEAPRLASAVDAELLAALKAVFGSAGIALRSVQPHLMAAFNGCRGRLRQGSAWFAVVEPGNLCLALLYDGCWSRVRSLRIGSAWAEELPLILEREAYLADIQTVPHEVYLWGAGDGALPEIEPWRFHALAPAQLPDAVAAQGLHFAMAMAG